ncbi:MAG: hypothetical protein KIH69_010830 [Anaerolineae bacterium]|nr:hypothetical protein [Anaerolineae bacterium]
MDPLSIIVTSFLVGAAEAIKPTASQVVKDAYVALKGALVRKFGDTAPAIQVAEKKPEKEASKEVVKDAIQESKADQDRDILALAQTLAEALKTHGATTTTTTYNINTGGGMSNTGNLTVNGDFAGRDMHKGDVVHGDKVLGNKIGTQINNYNTAPDLSEINLAGRGLVPLLNTYFNLSEIESLCFEMGIDDENLRGQTKDEKARSLVKHCESRGRLDELKRLMRVHRPILRAQLPGFNNPAEVFKPRQLAAFYGSLTIYHRSTGDGLAAPHPIGATAKRKRGSCGLV